MERRKRKLVELIRNYSFSYHHHLNNPSVETEDKFQKDKDAMAEYIDQFIFLPPCNDCFSAAHPERYHREKK